MQSVSSNLQVSELLQIFNLKFISAKATTTRMMGVVAIIVELEDKEKNKIDHIYHLDYEEYGIDGFNEFRYSDDLVKNELVEKESYRVFKSVSGGLGGELVAIDLEEFKYLLYTSYAVCKDSVEFLVEIEAYQSYIENMFTSMEAIYQITERESKRSLCDFERKLYKKLTPKIVNSYGVINYYMMRILGGDIFSSKFFLLDEENSPLIFKKGYTLLKSSNQLKDENIENEFITRLLIDFDEKYKILIFETRLKGDKVECVNMVESMEISSIEASFNLNKKENLYVYNTDNEMFERKFREFNSEFMKSEYYCGNLYTEFNPNNDHVQRQTYYLNGDLYGLYYFTRSGQLVIASFEKSNLEEIHEEIVTSDIGKNVNYICELLTETPILYSFINSDYYSIFEYFEDGVR